MNSADYTFLLNQPDAVNDRQTDALEKIVSEFPFFQSARALRLKGLYNQNSFQYNYALKVTAAYTTDRSVLFDFITSDTFTAIHKGLYEQKLAEIYGIEVNESHHVIEQNPEPAIDKVEQSILTSIRESETPYENDMALAEDKESEIAPETMEAAPEIPEPETTEDEILTETSENDITDTVETVSEIETLEEKLHIGKPLAFSKAETHSFQEWLQLSKIQPIQREETESSGKELTEEPLDKVKKNQLIDRFIETNPKIPQIKSDSKSAMISEPFKEDHSALMTETLARVYLEQKKYQKAIQAYEILILKYPEKSSFFADRISEIKNLQQNSI